MAATDFIVAIELGSSKISGIAGKKLADGSIQSIVGCIAQQNLTVGNSCLWRCQDSFEAVAQRHLHRLCRRLCKICGRLQSGSARFHPLSLEENPDRCYSWLDRRHLYSDCFWLCLQRRLSAAEIFRAVRPTHGNHHFHGQQDPRKHPWYNHLCVTVCRTAESCQGRNCIGTDTAAVQTGGKGSL